MTPQNLNPAAFPDFQGDTPSKWQHGPEKRILHGWYTTGARFHRFSLRFSHFPVLTLKIGFDPVYQGGTIPACQIDQQFEISMKNWSRNVLVAFLYHDLKEN